MFTELPDLKSDVIELDPARTLAAVAAFSNENPAHIEAVISEFIRAAERHIHNEIMERAAEGVDEFGIDHRADAEKNYYKLIAVSQYIRNKLRDAGVGIGTMMY